MVQGRAGTGGAGYELLEHTADVGIRARGTRLEAAFEQATQGLAEVLGAWRPGPGEPVAVEVSAGDLGGLLVDWLNEVLWLLEVRQAALAGVQVERVEHPRAPGLAPGAPPEDEVRADPDAPPEDEVRADPGAPPRDGVRAVGSVVVLAGGAGADGTFVKAATYHRLRVEAEPGGGWLVEVYLDV
jgi:SHS2 domain-containing protein